MSAGPHPIYSPASRGLFLAGSAHARGGGTTMTTGGIPPEGFSAGEIGGVFAGIVAGLAALGKGAAWLLNWNEARTSSKQARLEKWEASLAERERAYREEIEERLKHSEERIQSMAAEIVTLRSNQITLTAGVVDLATDLDRHAPTSPVLESVIRQLKALPLADPSPVLDALVAKFDARTPR